MRSKSVVVLFFAVILAAGFFYWKANYGRLDKSAALGKVLAPVFIKFGLVDDNLTGKTVETNRLDSVSYVSTYMEYSVPRSFLFSRFEPALKAALKNSGFKVLDIERSFKKDIERRTIIIGYGKFDILALVINRKGKAPPAPVVKEHKSPKIAIVVDDFGYSKNNIDEFLGLKQQVTISILPEQRYTREIAGLAKARGFEVILHLPLESNREDVVEETDTIRTGMSEKEILLHLKKELDEVPGADGVNNHMGSKATADTAVMTPMLRYLKSRNLYFLDSLTSGNSVCTDAARSVGVGCARRDIFLDNSNNTAAIEKQLEDLKIMAFKRGSAIAICHDRKNTAAVLEKVLPEMEKEGIEFVRLSALVNR